ncbi:Oidioi.mRNA.OKI2018_I69.chr1.g1046.t1.cds [Oikopleura dioica]|uniref:Oidioi.mRNA.OKI2018_I69.chr1.g1046.t1.cds n=1 Tax=Oikopleura dioica TaxID=34765 RepID=A0ABN7STV2_OIKDI|nr:Oidioi.mRNA.OKI2018_I69.chr1.g1046.t1.cds [Oikopleura dioica]
MTEFEMAQKANYIADLEFAAKIGKILLEQNQELDLHCQTLEKKVVDQDEQIRHLEKQLNILRDLEDNRCKVYDQLQSSCSEFEKENRQLAERHRIAIEQIEKLKLLSDEQEVQLNNLMEEMICIKGMGNSTEIKEENHQEEKKEDDDQLRLKVVMKDLELEKSRGKKLETDLNLIISDYDSLQKENDSLKDENGDLRKMNELHVERLKQLEEQAEFHSVKSHASTSDETLVKELDEKYNSLKCKYERIVTQINRRNTSKTTPEYNQIFRKLFSLLSDSIDEKKQALLFRPRQLQLLRFRRP